MAHGSVAGWGTIPEEVIWFINCPNPTSRTVILESTQPLTEMSTRNLPGGKDEGWQPHRHLWTNCVENMEALTFHNPMDLHGLLQG
jgi:hypothetical protein